MNAKGLKASIRLMTPRGEGGISVVRVRGDDALELVARMFRGASRTAESLGPGEMAYGRIVDEEARTVDEAIAARLPDRFLGDRAAYEINCHGGARATKAVMDVMKRAGAEVSDEPEPLFTLRGTALERELHQLLIRVNTELGARIVCDQLDGRLREEVDAIMALRESKETFACRLRALLDTARLGLRLTAPARVAIVGPPNAGKSTLMNRLLHTERVIVYHHPGTTRDVIRELASLCGVPVMLADTAGVAAETAAGGRTDEEAGPDAIAAQKAREEAQRAELLVVMFDGTVEPDAPGRFFAQMERSRAVFVMNKIDLETATHAAAYRALVGEDLLCISAERGTSVEELKAEIVRRLTGGCEYEGGAVLMTERQRQIVEGALEALRREGVDAAIERLREFGQGWE